MFVATVGGGIGSGFLLRRGTIDVVSQPNIIILICGGGRVLLRAVSSSSCSSICSSSAGSDAGLGGSVNYNLV